MAQSIHDKQENFKAVAAEVTSKPEAELTKEDAAHLMSAEVRLPFFFWNTTTSHGTAVPTCRCH